MMLSIKTAYQKLVKELTALYEEREAANVAALVFEDEFEVRNFKREDLLSPLQVKRLEDIQKRLLTFEPVQYVLGQADFFGLKFKVNSHVLIPRPETEELVYLILEEHKGRKEETLQVLDLGTGSGCIPICLKKHHPAWILTAADISQEAIAVARINAAENKCPVTFLQFDLLDKKTWPGQTYDIIVSNPPYIPPSEKKMMPSQVLRFEPQMALFTPEESPFLFYDKILDFASLYLNKGGKLFLECNEYNAPELLTRVQSRNRYRAKLIQDMSGKSRMLMAVLKGEGLSS